jgi:predicted RNA-binding protein with TRAM domain
MSYGGRGYGSGGGGGYGRDRGGFGGPKPVESGKEYEVQISEISRQGDGIARVQGFVIFVKGARVGEKTKIRVTNVGPRFATAEKVTSASTQQQQQQQPGEQKTEATQVAPPVGEEEKPELQDYKSKEEAHKK